MSRTENSLSMAPSNYGPLPQLLNVFLNCIFNNPHHDKAPFKQTIQELGQNHNEFTILVTPSFILQEAYDPATTSGSKQFLKDLCYNNEEFIRSHILRSSVPSFNSGTSSKNQSIVYYTLNSKQVLLKNGMIFTGKGFKKSLRLNITGFGQFTSVCDYFPKSAKFTLIYLEDSLYGSNFLSITDYMDPKFVSSSNEQIVPPNQSLVSSSSGTPSSSITFEMLLRNIPLLSKAVSEKYYKLFHHNNRDYNSLRTQTKKKLSFIKSEFYRMVEDAYTIISESIKAENPESEKTFQLIKSLLSKNPDIDLNKLVFEYVEMNMYDKVWSQLIFQFNRPNEDKHDFDPDSIKNLSHSKYNKLSCLSLNQLDIPITKPWHINTVLRRISLAINEFSKLSDTSIVNSMGKKDVITNVVKILTQEEFEVTKELDNEKSDSDELVVDADTLMGMLIMVVVHSKVTDLEAHLYYVRNFSSLDYSNDGYFNYILSNLDAVIYHLSPQESQCDDFKDLTTASQTNYEFWATIQKQDTEKLRQLLDKVDEEYPSGDLPIKHFMKSRNINGESCLMFAIKSKSFEAFRILIEANVNWFSVEDILFDRNTTTGQNLLMVSLSNEVSETSNLIVDILSESMSLDEQVGYLNSEDLTGRTVGHYLFHNLDILSRVGHLINWEIKDANSHTPLFSICRCYDHSDYTNLITKAFECVYSKSCGMKSIDFDDHMDKNGNTLLHVILKGLTESRILDKELNIINVNQFNKKSMCPLTLYVKYSRVSNLKDLLDDNRLDFTAEEPRNLYNVFDYLSFSAGKPTAQSKDFKVIEKMIYDFGFRTRVPEVNDCAQVFAANAKFDTSSKDWVIFFRFKELDGEEHTEMETLDKLRQMVQLFSLKNPFCVLPKGEYLWMDFKGDKQTVPAYSKYRLNRLLDTINMFLGSLSLYSTSMQNGFLQTFTFNENKKKSAFQIMKEVSKNQENAKRNLGDVMLSNNQITEIETFLSYSGQDLKNYKGTITRFNKLLSVYNVKTTDARVCYDRLIVKLVSSDLIPHIDRIKFNFIGEHKQLDSYDTLRDYINWIDLCTNNLIDSLAEVVDRLHQWREIYEKIRSINNELRRYESKANIHSHDVDEEEHNGHNDHNDHNGDVHLNDGPPSPTDMTIISTKSSDSTTSSFFSFGLENKKSRYRRLLLLKAEEVKAIMNLNSEIKLQHETVALEISRLFTFRSKFINYGLKMFTQSHLVKLRERKYQLDKLRSTISID